MAKHEVVYEISVKLSETEAAAISARGGTLSATATTLLRDYARGGAVIPAEWAARIQAAIDTVEASAIVDHVEKSVGRHGESVVVEWVVDPTQIQFYREQAENAGMTLQQQLKAHMDYGYAQGWLGSTAPDPFKLLLTAEQYRWLRQLCEKDVVTGSDVIARLHQAGATPSFVTEDDEDLVLNALEG
jgi:hypothetical protein